MCGIVAAISRQGGVSAQALERSLAGFSIAAPTLSASGSIGTDERASLTRDSASSI
jgi:hypothetical protein